MFGTGSFGRKDSALNLLAFQHLQRYRTTVEEGRQGWQTERFLQAVDTPLDSSMRTHS